MTVVINYMLGSGFLFVHSGHLLLQFPPKRLLGTRVLLASWFLSCLSGVLGGECESRAYHEAGGMRSC